jgi:hypothetical protein
MNVTFKVGDIVEWTSQAAGCTRTKRGEVVEVVPAGCQPVPMSKNRNPGNARDHESYLVRVKGAGLYWPRVSALRAPSGQEGGRNG